MYYYCIFLVEYRYCKTIRDNTYVCCIIISLHWYDIYKSDQCSEIIIMPTKYILWGSILPIKVNSVDCNKKFT